MNGVTRGVNQARTRHGELRSMFHSLEAVPADPILGLLDVIRQDPRPRKVNLTVGVYQTDSGETPVLECVRRAERDLLAEETTKDYLGIGGEPAFGTLVPELIWPEEKERPPSLAAFQALGGTGALRVLADFLHQASPRSKAWLSSPSWPNHAGVFRAAGLATADYRYLSPVGNAFSLEHMLADLEAAAPGDAVVLHGCCHNPTGADPTPLEWLSIAEFLARRELLPIVDLAYLGFAEGLAEDAGGVHSLARTCPEILIAVSFSKNLGLYRERAGAIVIGAGTPRDLAAVASRVRLAIRTNYSNPPGHAGAIVASVLRRAELRALWREELETMRTRIASTRREFVTALHREGAKADYNYLQRQYGLFAMTGLKPEQVQRLKDEFGVYLVGNGRINVAGLNAKNLADVARAFVAVE